MEKIHDRDSQKVHILWQKVKFKLQKIWRADHAQSGLSWGESPQFRTKQLDASIYIRENIKNIMLFWGVFFGWKRLKNYIRIIQGRWKIEKSQIVFSENRRVHCKYADYWFLQNSNRQLVSFFLWFLNHWLLCRGCCSIYEFQKPI